MKYPVSATIAETFFKQHEVSKKTPQGEKNKKEKGKKLYQKDLIFSTP